MLRSSINIFIIINIILLVVIIFSCSFIDLRPIQYSIEPHGLDSLLDDLYTPVTIKFDTEMVKNETESIIQVSSAQGSVRGDTHWDGNKLFFIPVSGWTAGIKYSLTINGIIRSIDGREMRVQEYASFYAVSKNPPPLLEKHFPADGESISTNNFSLILHFTNQMDTLSVESALSIDGVSNKTFEWSDENKVLKIIADKQLASWTQYRWTLKDSAKNTTGIPLPKQYSGTFTTNLDQTLPEVTRVYPVTFSNAGAYGSWSATGADIETGLSAGEGIAIEFNKQMDESALRSIRFEPSLTGRAEMLKEDTIVYIPTRNPEFETQYTLIVSADAKDTEGLKTGIEYRISFLPDIPYLRILSFNDWNDSGNPAKENIFPGIVLPIIVNEGTGEVSFSIRFSLPFTKDEKQIIAQKIILSYFFPRMLLSVSLQDVNWISDDLLHMQWEGVTAGKDGIKNIYHLKIPGGRGGISAGSLYMKEDVDIYLEALYEN